MQLKLIAYTIGTLIFLISFLISFMGISALRVLTFFFDIDLPHKYLSILYFFNLLLPLLIGFLIARTFNRWFERRKKIDIYWLPRNKIIITLLIFLYLLTAFSGIPSVQSHNSEWANKSFEGAKASDSDFIWIPPYFHTYLAVPILPFVVISYHEYHLAMLYGWGGWDIQIWYVVGVKRIVALPVWRS